MSDTIQSAEAFVDLLRKGGYSAPFFLSVEDADKKVEERDAAIRADEARKQEQRYAACVDLAEKVKQWAEAYPNDIFQEPTPAQCQEAFEKAGFSMTCFSAMVLRVFTKPWGDKATKALADMEATK
jgi:hypothetical protein